MMGVRWCCMMGGEVVLHDGGVRWCCMMGGE